MQTEDDGDVAVSEAILRSRHKLIKYTGHPQISLGVIHVLGMVPQYVNVLQVKLWVPVRSNYVSNWGFPEAEQFV